MMDSKNTQKTAPAANSTPTQNLLEVCASNGSFKTFGQAVEKAGLSDTLRGTGPFTVFAPTDKAFEQLPAGRLEALYKPENKAELASLINYHVVDGRRSSADVGKWESARTVNGQPAPIKLTDNKIRIDGAQVTHADLQSSNGIIHGIDKVNVPTMTKPTVQ